ncbi:nuclear transport factor 2 family protein [Ghiorsea bivora]|uniref:nuclear transport factor 2 family protein n=1 Tax=Ghiorsea bivora TaxID=1485545 RepID=UPI00056E7675|nr:tetratricopeptide repeat protein [Ghiorsea bivora]
MKNIYASILITLLMFSSPALAYDVTQAKADLKQGRYTETIEQLRSLVKSDANNYEAWFLFGVAHVHQQQLHQAIEAFRQVINLRPDLAEPHNNLAAVYNNLGDTKAAVKELEIALEKRPNYTIAEENLADLYIKLALQHYRNTLKTSPNPVIEQRYARLIQVRNPMPDDHANQTPHDTPVPEQKATQHTEKQTTQPHILTPIATVKPQAEQHHTTVMPLIADQSITGVLDALEAWREAWSSQNLDAFFSAYADDYQPPARFQSRDAWKAYKKRVINNKLFIRIELDQVEVNMQGKDMATVKLLQRFHSNTYNGKDFKKITFKYTPQGWRIIDEASVQ